MHFPMDKFAVHVISTRRKLQNPALNVSRQHCQVSSITVPFLPSDNLARVLASELVMGCKGRLADLQFIDVSSDSLSLIYESSLPYSSILCLSAFASLFFVNFFIDTATSDCTRTMLLNLGSLYFSRSSDRFFRLSFLLSTMQCFAMDPILHYFRSHLLEYFLRFSVVGVVRLV